MTLNYEPLLESFEIQTLLRTLKGLLLSDEKTSKIDVRVAAEGQHVNAAFFSRRTFF